MISGQQRRRAALAALATVVVAGCASPTSGYKVSLQGMIAAGNYDGAAAWVEHSRKEEYGKRNAVLYYLDKGAVLHDSGLYLSSERAFDRAEQLIDELYTRSVSKAAARFFVNDATEDYAGAPHERVLLHLYRALNYAYLLQTDEAIVEARKVSLLLTEFRERYQLQSVYRDDGFAHYLSSLLFEDAGRWDDARISHEMAARVYAEQRDVFYAEPPPAPMAPGPGEGEIVVIHYNGFAPRKISNTIQVAWNEAFAFAQANKDENGAKEALVAGVMANAITVAIPQLVQDDYRVRGSEVSVGGRAAPSYMVENVSAISLKLFQESEGAATGRAIARAFIKFVLAKGAEAAARKAGGDTIGTITGILSRAVAAGSESADTRCWASAPAEIRIARLIVPAGKQAVRVRFMDASGYPIGEQSVTAEVIEGERSYVHVRSAY